MIIYILASEIIEFKTMKALKFPLAVLCFSLFWMGCKKEETETIDTSMGSIRGSITTFDEYAGVIYQERSNIKIDVTNDFQSFTTNTDLAGDYNIASVPNQKYNIKYSKSGFVTWVQNDVNIDFENSDFPVTSDIMTLPNVSLYKKIFWTIEEIQGNTVQNIVGLDTLYDVRITASLSPAPFLATQFAGYRVFISTNDTVSKENYIWQEHYTTNNGALEVIITESKWRSLGLTSLDQVYVKIYGDIKPDISYLNDQDLLIFPGTTETSSEVVEVELD
jgi:hypothetical protein